MSATDSADLGKQSRKRAARSAHATWEPGPDLKAAEAAGELTVESGL